MAQILVPLAFQNTIIKMFGGGGESWLGALPKILDKCIDDWQLEVDATFQVSLSFNFVVPVRRQNGELGVLKVGPHLKGRAREAQMLRMYNGNGAVRLLEFDKEYGALLMERVSPGLDLQSLWVSGEVSDRISTEIAVSVLQKFGSLLSANSLPSVSIWGMGFEKFLRENRRGTLFPIEKVIKADGIFKELVATTVQVTALHGDLHHANILKSSDSSWLSIDPKGVSGDLAYEVGAFMRNPMPELSYLPDLEAVLEARLRQLSLALEMDIQRLWGWSYSQSVLAAIWSVAEDQDQWRQWLVVAEAFEKIESAIKEKA
jgi:streptomycin 6-kinase